MNLPQYARHLLSACPAAGTGVNIWTFRVARTLHPFYPDKRELENVIAAACYGCGREVSAKEIARSVERSEQYSKPGAVSGPRAPKWPEYNADMARGVAEKSDVQSTAELWEASPVRLEDGPHADDIIDALFPGNPLLCVGKRKNVAHTKPREEWRGKLASLPLIVPSPMSARTGYNQDGKLTERSLDNTGPRKFLVVEFDEGDITQQAACAWYLASLAPCVLALHSGSKSLHTWFNCQKGEERDWLRFMRHACELGGDSAGWVRCQLQRIPDGKRIDKHPFGARQTVYYFNPEAL